MADESDDARFEHFMKEALAGEALHGVPPDLKAQLSKGLRKKFEQPPMEAIMLSLGRQLTLEEVQRMLFYPTNDDACLYPLLIIGPPKGAPAEHFQNKLQRVAIVTSYTRHVNDWAFVEHFVLAGGLNALAELAVHEDLHIRSQIVEMFLQITNEDRFAWHTDEDGKDVCRHPSSSTTVKTARADKVRHRMFQLVQSPFALNMLANRHGSYPRGSFDCLRGFAFFVSFVRCPPPAPRPSPSIPPPPC
mmetsp:Transcript_43623/g.72682  ORF Transcript_43623/g.72682 Transcript_43623/m.72682 type:complete len:247 (-) Transcript_43623:39-779(-)